MIDVESERIFIRYRNPRRFVDKTAEIEQYVDGGSEIWIRFHGASESRSHARRDILIMRDPARHTLDDGTAKIEICGEIWRSVTEAYSFDWDGQTWWWIWYSKSDGEGRAVRSDDQVRLITNSLGAPGVVAVLDYWKSIASCLGEKGRLVREFYRTLDYVHPHSALGRYLEGAANHPREDLDRPLIFPFRSNLSQRDAVRRALRTPISVIYGPPGTGKTETILNLVANIVVDPKLTVAVVSRNNAAVDNVVEKLSAADLGFIAANLGNASRQEEFFAGQEARNRRVSEVREDESPTFPPAQHLVELDLRIQTLQASERRFAELRLELSGYELERRHFRGYFDRHELPDLGRLPILARSSDTILEFLADSDISLAHRGPVGRLIDHVRRYFRYGRTSGIDPSDLDSVLRLQQIYYDKKIDELTREVDRLKQLLRSADFQGLSDKQRMLSAQWLRGSLWRRYQSRPRIWRRNNFKREFGRFRTDYPVILSTCHSLRNSINTAWLVDYLIIDEASQVDLLEAGAAMSCARNLVVIGDGKQLQHIADVTVKAEPPASSYDYQEHSILAALEDLYGDDLPRTELIEHYRCAPDIIEFCSSKYYDGRLIPYRQSEPEKPPMEIWRTPPGNHMRHHRGGGNSNQREIDVIREEVIPDTCADVPTSDIGIATPYRKQVSKLDAEFIDTIESDTVHKFQGRQKPVIILTTVLDESKIGHIGKAFVDDPRMINVAVSRASDRFILVINSTMLPKCRHIRDLVGYIEYRDPERNNVFDSDVVSVFDLLYRDYAEKLRPLASRRKTKARWESENIMWKFLQEVTSEDEYRVFDIRYQVKLGELVSNTERLNSRQRKFVSHSATSVDFVLFNRVTKELACAIEVDGFKYHEDNPVQLERDAMKDAICAEYGIRLLRFPTTGSGESDRIRQALSAILADEG